MRRFLRFRFILGATLFCVGQTTFAACYAGYDSTKCLQQIAKLQAQLVDLHKLEELNAFKRLESYDQDFGNDALQSLRETAKALEKYKDADCNSKFLLQGMSSKDSGVLADECRMNWRAARIAELRRKMRLKK